MNKVEEALRNAMADLAACGVRPALVGGLAVSARTEPRFTRDVDFAISVSGDHGAETLVGELTARGYRIVALVEQDTAKRLATTRLAAPGGDAAGIVVDLLFASSGIEPEIVARAQELEVFPGLRVPVATVGDLIAMKILSRDDKRRPQDAADLRALLAAATPPDRAAAQAALDEIAARGFHRDRDLRLAFAAAVDDFGGR